MCVCMNMSIFAFTQKQDKFFPSKSFFFFPAKVHFISFSALKTGSVPSKAFLLFPLIPYGYICVGRELCYMTEGDWVTLASRNLRGKSLNWCKSETSQVPAVAKRGLAARNHTSAWVCLKPAVAVVHFWIDLSFTERSFTNDDPGLTEFSKPPFGEHRHLPRTFQYYLLTACI